MTDNADLPDLSPTKPRRRRGKTAALIVLAVLPVALTAIAQPLLPDSVPLHYGASGTPDEWGPKARLFLSAGIFTVLALVIAAFHMVIAHQQETGREDWIASSGKISFPVTAILLGILAILQTAYVGLAFYVTETALPSATGALYVDVLMVCVLGAMLAPALYMLITGEGLSLVNFHPGTSDLERQTGADKQQARAIGGLLLFLALFVLMEFLLISGAQ